jgi:outer membrane protein, heavy metal efflux system
MTDAKHPRPAAPAGGLARESMIVRLARSSWRGPRRRVAAWLLVLVAAATAACGRINHDLQRQVAAEAAGLVPAVGDDAAVQHLAETVGAAGLPAPDGAAIAAAGGLADYVRIALRDNPAIHQAIRNLQALGYRVPQVTSLDDPMVNVIPPTGDMTETAAGMMQGAGTVSQKLPFPGKLSARGRVAEQSVRMALYALAEARIHIVAEVQKAYYGYYLADVSIQISRRSEDLLRQFREVAAARYRAGAATQQDVLRAEVQLYALTNELITLGQRQATARARLNTLMNRAVDAPLPPPASFDLAAVEWRLPEALDRALTSNPRLAGLRERIRRDLESIKLARLDYYPDLNLGFGYTGIASSGISPVATGDDTWNLALGFNLPIWWQRLRARVLESNAQALASVEEYADVRNLVSFEVQDALVKIDTEYRQAVLLRDLIVPRAWQTVEVSTSAYRAGNLEFTALIDNWRAWLDFSLRYQTALAQLEQRFADLQQLLGAQVPRVAAAAAGGATQQPHEEGTGER